MIKVYIAGPMNSVGGNFNFPLFDHVAKRLREKDCEVYSPADHARKAIGPLEMIMKFDKKEMAKKRREMLKDELVWICENADYVLMLPGWERSTGATAERAVALALEIPVHQVPNIVLFDSSLDSWEITSLKRIED